MFLNFSGSSRGGLAHVELAGDHIGDQAGAVFAQEFDLRLSAVA